jgi:hypothetical protein
MFVSPCDTVKHSSGLASAELAGIVVFAVAVGLVIIAVFVVVTYQIRKSHRTNKMIRERVDDMKSASDQF